ncbi:MAG: hypothetical protein F2817_16675, partial [Actinobacteria bacterium]|nr:hypothetical protein [Actinomycetota bacterium]
MAAPAQTTSDVPEPTATADPIALAAFVSRRAGRVLAYLDAVTAPSRALDAAAETFASYRVARAADPDAEAPATTLLRATRRAAAVHAENPLRPDGRERTAARTNACAAMPRLLIAWTESRLPEADVARLVEHLQGCPDCRALRDAFDRAELGYRAGESTDPDATEVGVITTAMARAGGAPAPVAALPRDEATPGVDGPRGTPASEPTRDATPAEAPDPATRGHGDDDGDGRSSRVPPRDRRPAGRSSLPESPARPATDG